MIPDKDKTTEQTDLPKPVPPEKDPGEPTPAVPAHSAEKEEAGQPSFSTMPHPHMAEKEPVTSAGFVTVRTKRGKATVLVESSPQSGTHATVVDQQNADEPRKKKGRRRDRKQRARQHHSPRQPDVPASSGEA